MKLQSEWADIMDKAADEIIVRGWSNGEEIDPKGRVCARGALKLACGNEVALSGFWIVLLDDTREQFYNLERILGKFIYDKYSVLDFAYYEGDGIVSGWNDSHTENEVLQLLRNCAKYIREKTQEGAN